MASRHIPLLLAPIALVYGAFSCKPETASDPLPADVCRAWCLFYVGCYDYPTMNECETNCRSSDEAYRSDYGDACADAHLDYLACYADLTCEEFSELDSCQTNCPIPCPDALAAVEEHCSG